MPLLSVVIPAYNEEKTIMQVVKRVEACSLPDGFDREIIIVNDGSTDGTAKTLESFEHVHTVIHSKNTGKGGAVQKGFRVSRGSYIVVQDADLEQNPEEFKLLMAPLLANEADVVFGSRFIGAYKPLSLLMSAHYMVNKMFTVFTNILTGYKTSDVWTGYKMYSRQALFEILPNLKSNGIDFELEVVFLLGKAKMRIADVPISYEPRWYDEGKKTNWKQAVKSLCKLLVFKFR